MMKRRQDCLRFSVALTIAGFLFVLASQAQADPPKAVPQQLQKAASHVVTGSVAKVYTSESFDEKWVTTDCVAEIVVATVTKGKSIAANDRIFVKYRYRDWIENTPINKAKREGQRGHKAGTFVQLYLQGNGSDGFKVCEPNGFAVPVAAPMVGLKSLPDYPFVRDENSACLVVTNSVGLGDNQITFEFTTADKTISTTIDHSYNDFIGHNSRSGSLSSIVEIVTGSVPKTPSQYQTVDSILSVMKENGWTIVDNETHDDPAIGPLGASVRTINFQRKIAE